MKYTEHIELKILLNTSVKLSFLQIQSNLDTFNGYNIRHADSLSRSGLTTLLYTTRIKQSTFSILSLLSGSI
jgi:hypothetical protein